MRVISNRASFNIQTRGQKLIFSGLCQRFYEIKFAYLSSAVLIKTEETCGNASIFSALGYQANIDASDALGAMNFQTCGIVFWLTQLADPFFYPRNAFLRLYIFHKKLVLRWPKF